MFADQNVRYFESPNYPANYDNNLDCLWFITSSNGENVEIEFETFNVSEQYTLMAYSIYKLPALDLIWSWGGLNFQTFGRSLAGPNHSIHEVGHFKLDRFDLLMV